MSSPLLASIHPVDLPESHSVQLTLPAVAENASVARQVLAGLAESLGADEELITDMKLAVTEAINNVVMHAYPQDATGVAEVTITVGIDQLGIIVTDHGSGMNPLPTGESATAGAGYGLALIASLCDRFSVSTASNGTEVRMGFALGREAEPEIGSIFDATPVNHGPAPRGEIVLTLTPDTPASLVLGRFISLLAAGVGLSLDRISDLQLVSDALAMHAPRQTATGAFHVTATRIDSGFDLRVGPLAPGGTEAIISGTTFIGVGSLLHRVTDGVATERGGDAEAAAEILRLTLVRAPRD